MNILNICKKAGALDAAVISLQNPQFLKVIQENSLRYHQWIEEGYAGEMTYLQRMAEAKANPQKTFGKAKNAVVITFNNNWGCENAKHPFPKPQGSLIGYISAYAKEQDYHRTGHKILKNIQDELSAEFANEQDVFFEPSVDTKPVFERLFAVFGGLGILGPNELLRTPQNEVRVFIGTLFTSLDLPELLQNPQMPYPCKYCNNCVEGCNTGALSANGIFDARKCSSYLSIEHRGFLSSQQADWLEDWLFGCDWCSEVCPPKDKKSNRIPIDLEWLLKESSGKIKRMLKGTAIEYAGVTQLRKNAVVILKKMDSPKANELLQWAKKNSNSPIIQEQLDVQF